jgi:predicted transcriptional regulator
MQFTKTKTLPSTLTRDQFEALAQVSVMPKGGKGSKPSACVARNAKHLSGTKYLVARRDGSYQLTDKGEEALFTKNCISGLRATADALSQHTSPPKLAHDVTHFLTRKGYLLASATGQISVTDKGHECLADITAHG